MIAERFCKELQPFVAHSRLFNFPGRAHEVLRSHGTPWDELVFLQDNFFLPFPFVVIEDTASCVLLWDTVKDQRGFKEPRFFVECLPMISSGEFADSAKHTDEAREMAADPELRDVYVVHMGEITGFEVTPDKKLKYTGKHFWSMAATKHRVCRERASLRTGDPMTDKIYEDAALRNAVCALEEIFFFNSPNRFVVQKTPKAFAHKIERWESEGKCVRSDKRPVYTLLTPKEIRDTLRLPAATGGGTKAAHERRRHFRTLRSDVFKTKQGQTVVIPACWVGPSEAEHSGHQYRVCLEL
jgi:hypothetical protein